MATLKKPVHRGEKNRNIFAPQLLSEEQAKLKRTLAKGPSTYDVRVHTGWGSTKKIHTIQGASAGHQLCFVELKLQVCVSNSGGSAIYINNGLLRHTLHVHHGPEQGQVGHGSGKEGGSKVVCF